MDSVIRIFITNLGKYNEGELVGKWVDLPISDDELEEVLREIGIGDNDEFGQPYEEYFITDYETDVGISIGEYDSIERLNELAEELEQFDEYEIEVINAYIDEVSGDLNEAMDVVRSGEYTVWRGCKNMSDVAYDYVDSIGGVGNLAKDTIDRYFDYDSYGREMKYDGTFVSLDDSIIEFYY